MSQTAKKRKQRQREQAKVELPDQRILDLIGNPNAWTPEVEDIWLKELRKVPAGEIYRRFPPLKKPPSVRKRGKESGWGGNNA